MGLPILKQYINCQGLFEWKGWFLILICPNEGIKNLLFNSKATCLKHERQLGLRKIRTIRSQLLKAWLF